MIIKNPMASLTDPLIIKWTLTSPNPTYGIISANITHHCTGGECEHTGMVTLEGRMDTNNTELHCAVYSLQEMMLGDPATLTVIGKK